MSGYINVLWLPNKVTDTPAVIMPTFITKVTAVPLWLQLGSHNRYILSYRHNYVSHQYMINYSALNVLDVLLQTKQ